MQTEGKTLKEETPFSHTPTRTPRTATSLTRTASPKWSKSPTTGWS